MASQRNGTLYIGVTSNLAERVWQHKQSEVEGFSATYRTHRLVWYEWHDDARGAIQREKNLKHWLRKWKLALIESVNPNWDDVYDDLHVM